MELPGIVKQTWGQLLSRLTSRFNSEGYQVVNEQHHDPVYGSCFVIWSNNIDALRLTWDGKESWFILEEAELPISAVTLWKEIIVAPFDEDKHDPVYIHAIVQDIMDSLD